MMCRWWVEWAAIVAVCVFVLLAWFYGQQAVQPIGPAITGRLIQPVAQPGNTQTMAREAAEPRPVFRERSDSNGHPN